jgi:FtsH-binding integral membrane protein
MNMDYRPQVERIGIAIDVRDVMQRVYVWMVVGLLVTAGTAFLVAGTGLWTVLANPVVLFGAIIAELVLVVAISAGVNRMSATTAGWLFALYSAINGFTLSLIFLAYTGEDIALAFVATAAMFGAMSIVGYTTQMDLTRVGSILFMGLIGMIVASVVNIFLASSTLYWIVTYLGVVIFVGLTAYDTQRIRRMAESVSVAQDGQEAAIGRLSVIGALILYLDFINLFLLILRIVGRRR